MNRRYFLVGSGAVVVSQLLAGCGGKNQATLRVRVLKGSIPAQIVNEFRKSLAQSVQLNLTPVEQIQTLFKQLQTWQHKSSTQASSRGWNLSVPFVKSESTGNLPDLVTLGDYWLAAAIEQKLIQPLDQAQLKRWSGLPSKWQQLVTRNDQGKPDKRGKIWAAPYRWGTTVIVYDRNKFQKLGWTPKDWSDLWRPELRDRLTLLDNPREVIGLTLKKLGKSYNTEKLDQVSSLETELQTLNNQVKFYSSNTYLEPLISGDTWLAVGWSNDVLPVIQRYQQLAAVVPQSGTALWADLWVNPRRDVNNNLLHQWIDFCWQPKTAKEISLLTDASSPIPTDLVASDFQESLRQLLLINQDVFAKSEFLLPLSPNVIKEYETLFAKVKGY
ncbi:MAG: extracellular solute-binding protein [Nostocaceae cyanobacterium]|nr:extracellular solute-binding protein [Nostocaceae cyanobacterium]